ncbi:amino acid ABC transporter substrate-binding protein [Teichococcus oryzae]|uniref:Amino acid ABC transporter substrate-binding protein n=1 Tax=Teichococcus oryzae TaxID=1608942 RepID=A0A5B2THG0_9PROT|nr:amino acid ABC transporter substrate-binding protein [Pseudoroseomonas oryzae]KAA2213368.1 amino acid ABC transporter substrate-binding protein [Pseudoroseomonas oryzae]
MTRRLRILALLAGLAVPALPPPAEAQTRGGSPTLDAIRARGALVCGTSPDLPGFAFLGERGEFSGLYIDFCKAVAAAVLGDAAKVRYVPTTYANRLTALQAGEIDILSSNTTWTMPREAALGLMFTGVLFYDGQGFLVSRKLGVASAKQLDGASVCVQPGTTTEKNLADYFRASGMRLNPVVIESVEEIRNALVAGRCDAFTVGTSTLAAFREGLGDRKEDYIVLPEIISKEPLGPVVRKGDERFFDVVRWTQNAMILAEEFGITSGNLASRMDDAQPDVQRLLGRSDDFGAMLGLNRQWAVDIIRQVGNLGEVWNRHVAPMGLPRGRNALYTEGGLQYAPPIR